MAKSSVKRFFTFFTFIAFSELLLSAEGGSGSRYLSLQPAGTCLNSTDQSMTAPSLAECTPKCLGFGYPIPCYSFSYNSATKTCSISRSHGVHPCTGSTTKTFVTTIIPATTTTTPTTTTTMPTTTTTTTTTTTLAPTTTTTRTTTATAPIEAPTTAPPASTTMASYPEVELDDAESYSKRSSGSASYITDDNDATKTCFGSKNMEIYVNIDAVSTHTLYRLEILGGTNYANELNGLVVTTGTTTSNSDDNAFASTSGTPTTNPVILTNEAGVPSTKIIKITKTDTSSDLCIYEIKAYGLVSN